MKKIIVYLLFGLIFLGCVGCRKTDKVIEEIQEETYKSDTDLYQDQRENTEVTLISYNFPDTYSMEVENVIFNMKVTVNDEVLDNGLYKTTAFSQKIDGDKAYNILFNGVEIKDSTEVETEYGKQIHYIGTNDEIFHMTKDSVSMSNSLYRHIINTFSMEGSDYNADEYLTGKEFAFMSIVNAYQDVVDTASEFGMDVSGSYNCYSLDYEKMKENEYAIDHKGKEDISSYKDNWTEEDNCYFFAIHQMLQDCIVQYPIADVFKEVCDANAPVQALYTKNGLEMLSVRNIFTFKQTKEPLLLKDFEEIADAIANKYNMILADSKYEVTEAELFWRPMESGEESFEMIPAWEITVLEVSSGRTLHMYVNAVTAEEIL